MLVWRNKPSVAQHMYTDHRIEEEEHSQWFSTAMRDPDRRYWIITLDGLDLGLVNLYNIDQKNKRCHWAFYIGEEGQRGKGIGAFVEHAVLRHVFEEMKMEKLCCEVLASNVRVANMHKNFGFKEEGIFRKHIYKAGVLEDVVCLAILGEDWESVRPIIESRLRKIENRRA